MSDYTITTNFGAKDSLPSGNAGKVIKGSEFTTEFTNIKTAVNTKADTAGDTFTGVVNFSADVAVNTNTLFVDVSTARVGIGTDSPAYKLDVTGSAQLSGGDLILRSDSANADTQSIRFENSSDDTRSAYIRADYATNSSGNATSLVFGTNPSTSDGSNRMVIDSTGNVGIGTTSPEKKLHVKDGDIRIESTFPRIYLTDTDSDSDYSIINSQGAFSIYDDTNTAYRMQIDASGNVGIGTTSPDSALHIDSSGSTALTIQRDSGASSNVSIKYDGASQDYYTGIASTSEDFVIGTNANLNTDNLLRVTSAGNLLVSKTSDAFEVEGISLRGSPTTNASLATFTRDGSNVAAFNRLTNDGSVLNFYKDGTTVGSISVTSSATAYNTSSDERLKENITDSADAGSKVDAIQIRQFDWKADGSHQDYGVIAQELINVAPEAVSEGDAEEDMMGVDYSKLVPMLIKEIQSLRSRVAELENK
jgi:hypothetical protein